MAWENLKNVVSNILTTNDNGDITAELLRTLINNNVIEQLGEGQFKGFALPSTVPNSSDRKHLYFASEKGVYVNFSGLEILNSGLYAIDNFSGSWVLTLIYDSASEINSENLKTNYWQHNRFIDDIDVQSTTDPIGDSGVYFDGFISDCQKEDALSLFGYKGNCLSVSFANVNNAGVFISKSEIENYPSYDNTVGFNIEYYLGFASTGVYGIYQVTGTSFVEKGIKAYNHAQAGVGVFSIDPTVLDANYDKVALRIFPNTTQWNNQTIKIGRIFCYSGQPTGSLEYPVMENNRYLKEAYKSISQKPNKIYCWGAGFTSVGQYQVTLASELGIDLSRLINRGIESGWTQHVRTRFVEFYTGNTAEKKHPVIIFMGTNNLMNYNRVADQYTSGSSEFLALQPNPEFRYDRMYAKSYKSQFLSDLKQMMDVIGHKNVLIVSGFVPAKTLKTEKNHEDMESLDYEISILYPENYINARKVLIENYDYLNVSLSSFYIQPNIGSNVVISVNDASQITALSRNPSQKICIGTKENYDLFSIVSVSSNQITVQLEESNLGFNSGEGIQHFYRLVTDVGRDEMYQVMRVFSYDDVLSFETNTIPYSCTSDGIHPNYAYDILGKAFAEFFNKN